MNKKLVLSLVGLGILVVGVGVGVWLVQKQQKLHTEAAPATILSFSPSQKSVQEGEVFTLPVVIDTAQNTVSAAELHIKFDANLVHAQSIQKGSFLPVELAAGSVDNALGRASIILGVSPGETEKGKKGQGTLAVLAMRAVSSGTASITFLPDTKVAGIGEGSTNVLISSSPASVTITKVQAAATQNPTAAPTASPASTSQSGSQSPSPQSGSQSGATGGSGSQQTQATSTASPKSTATPKATAVARSTATAKTTTPAPELPKAGVSWPATVGIFAGALILILGVVLAF